MLYQQKTSNDVALTILLGFLTNHVHVQYTDMPAGSLGLKDSVLLLYPVRIKQILFASMACSIVKKLLFSV